MHPPHNLLHQEQKLFLFPLSRITASDLVLNRHSETMRSPLIWKQELESAAAKSKTAEDTNTDINARCFKDGKVLMYLHFFQTIFNRLHTSWQYMGIPSSCDIKKFRIFLTPCIYLFGMALTINTEYFSKQHEHVYLCSGAFCSV